uniref:OB domain-containing protein n=1 Tax=Anopheles farauti TaxID=69004 RepID=A0A182QAU4_9DIPT
MCTKMSFRKKIMFNNRSCPQTPVPRSSGPRFPMSAAILETPSIMSSFCETKPKQQPDRPLIEPPAKQFIMSLNESFVENRNIHQPPATGSMSAKSQLNSSFLDCSFTSNYSIPSSMNRKVPLASSSGYNLNTSMPLHGESHWNKPAGLKSFHRTGVPNLHNTFNSSSGVSSYGKRPFSEDNCSKYGNTLPVKQLTAAASIPDASVTKSTYLRILTGTIEHIQRAIREHGRLPLLIETVANIVSVKSGPRAKEKVILLRYHNQGPAMQGVFYEIDQDLPQLAPGDLVRCVGRLQPVGNRLQILKITHTTEQYDRAIVRLQTASAFCTKVRR